MAQSALILEMARPASPEQWLPFPGMGASIGAWIEQGPARTDGAALGPGTSPESFGCSPSRGAARAALARLAPLPPAQEDGDAGR